MEYNRVINTMKKILLTLAFIAIVFVANAQTKTLTQTQRESCDDDIDYAYKMAKEGYAEAEYIFAKKFYYVDSYESNETYQKYWKSYSPNNPLVCSAYWLKNACVHGCVEAYPDYAEFCFHGRGDAKGGPLESMNWLNKYIEKNPNDLDALANIGICYYNIGIPNSGFILLNSVILKFMINPTLKMSSDVYLYLCQAYLYGCGTDVSIKDAFTNLDSFLSLGNGRFTNSYMDLLGGSGYVTNAERATLYWIYCSNHGYNKNITKDELQEVLDGYNEIFEEEYDFKDVDNLIEVTYKKSGCDFLFIE